MGLSFSRAAPVLAVLVLAGAFSMLGTRDAVALCNYGTPHCVNPNPGPKLPTVGGVQIPPDPWHDPECGYYGNCNTTSPLTRGTGAGGTPGSRGKVYTK